MRGINWYKEKNIAVFKKKYGIVNCKLYILFLITVFFVGGLRHPVYICYTTVYVILLYMLYYCIYMYI